MATLQFHIIKKNNKRYFKLIIGNLTLHLDKLCAVQFEFQHEDGSQQPTFNVIDGKRTILQGRVRYRPGHADTFLFCFDGSPDQHMYLNASDLRENHVFAITAPKFKRKSDMISEIIFEGYDPVKNQYFSKFLKEDLLQTGDEWYWKMKYLLAVSDKRWKKNLSAGTVTMKSTFGK